MKGHVVVPCRPDHARHIEFFQMLYELDLPNGWDVKLYAGFFPHRNRLTGTRAALASGAEWVFYVDDDQILKPDTIRKLLARNVDIVSCNLLMKEDPWHPYMYERIGHEKGMFPIELTPQMSGLQQVDACGLGGVLVHRRVFDAITDVDWFGVDEHFQTDDFYFCSLVRARGFKVHVDLDVPAGHIVKAAVWPYRTDEGYWKTVFHVAGGGTFGWEAAKYATQYQEWRAQRIAEANVETLDCAFHAEL